MKHNETYLKCKSIYVLPRKTSTSTQLNLVTKPGHAATFNFPKITTLMMMKWKKHKSIQSMRQRSHALADYGIEVIGECTGRSLPWTAYSLTKKK